MTIKKEFFEEMFEVLCDLRKINRVMKKHNVENVTFEGEKVMIITLKKDCEVTIKKAIYEQFKMVFYVKLGCDKHPPFKYETMIKFCNLMDEMKLTKAQMRKHIEIELVKLSMEKKKS